MPSEEQIWFQSQVVAIIKDKQPPKHPSNPKLETASTNFWHYYLTCVTSHITKIITHVLFLNVGDICCSTNQKSNGQL
jgi:hypothetical protein